MIDTDASHGIHFRLTATEDKSKIAREAPPQIVFFTKYRYEVYKVQILLCSRLIKIFFRLPMP